MNFHFVSASGMVNSMRIVPSWPVIKMREEEGEFVEVLAGGNLAQVRASRLARPGRTRSSSALRFVPWRACSSPASAPSLSSPRSEPLRRHCHARMRPRPARQKLALTRGRHGAKYLYPHMFTVMSAGKAAIANIDVSGSRRSSCRGCERGPSRRFRTACPCSSNPAGRR